MNAYSLHSCVWVRCVEVPLVLGTVLDISVAMQTEARDVLNNHQQTSALSGEPQHFVSHGAVSLSISHRCRLIPPSPCYKQLISSPLVNPLTAVGPRTAPIYMCARWNVTCMSGGRGKGPRREEIDGQCLATKWSVATGGREGW